MKIDFLKPLGAAALAGGLLLAPPSALSAVYNLQLTGVVADGAYSTSTDTRFYDLTLLTEDGFTPFELAVGDVLNLTVTLDELLGVPAGTDITFFGVDVLTSRRFDSPPGDGAVSFGEVTPLDGNLAGTTYGSACTNCVAASLILSPGPAFSISRFTASITIENLPPFGSDDSPVFANGFELGYQVSDLPGVVPEPATWAMMISGFALSGVALRRRRQTATA